MKKKRKNQKYKKNFILIEIFGFQEKMKMYEQIYRLKKKLYIY